MSKAKKLINFVEQDKIKEAEEKVIVMVNDKRGNEMKAEVVNPHDLFNDDMGGEPFWKHIYLLQMQGGNFVINSDNSQEAIDEFIDYCEDNAPGLILSDEEEEEAQEDGSLDDYVQGGNSGRYLNEPIMREQMREINFGDIKRA
jgi:hypothetical protein